MTSPASDDHGVGREYQVPSWLDPIYTQTQRTIMGRVRPRRGHPFLKFHPQTKEFEWLGDQPRKIFLCRAASTKYEPEVKLVKRRQGRPRKEVLAPSTEGTPVSPIEEPPRKKRGRLQKSSTPKESTAEESLEPCGCDVLVQMVQKPRTVKDYLEDFLDTAKTCKTKPAFSGADAKLKRSSAENSRRPKTLAVELSLSPAPSLSSLSSLPPPRRCRVVVVVVAADWWWWSDLAALLFPCSRYVQISSPLSLVSRSGSRSRLRWSVLNPTFSHDSVYSFMLELGLSSPCLRARLIEHVIVKMIDEWIMIHKNAHTDK
ncbi:hypothetical protein F2Q69_00050431 [Brassica cretica]|uniref:Uncharacterized protein n=1 Tax=Brassica cretica TaxID=69181 RepID=A0A8S9PPB4_BRACR|nr:hypothetical protein F2Q69_00050431 [Brassica cretica]